MNMYKKYALILSVLMISQVSSPAVNVLADENNTSQSYQNETSNEKTSESIEVLQKQNEIVNIPDANLKKVLNKVLNIQILTKEILIQIIIKKMMLIKKMEMIY